jgi:hypothetical protein
LDLVRFGPRRNRARACADLIHFRREFGRHRPR